MRDLIDRLGSEAPGLSGPILEEIQWETLRALQDRQEPALREIASAASAKAASLLGGGADQPSGGAFVAGQLACLAMLARAALSRDVPKAAERLLHRKNARRLLRFLKARDQRLSDLARAAGLDVSQADREIDSLAEHDLVRTDKQGHERWIRITDLGRTALERDRPRAIRSLVKEQTRTSKAALDELADRIASVDQRVLVLGRVMMAVQDRLGKTKQKEAGTRSDPSAFVGEIVGYPHLKVEHTELPTLHFSFEPESSDPGQVALEKFLGKRGSLGEIVDGLVQNYLATHASKTRGSR